MSSFYYLISSLPTLLSPESELPFSVAEFEQLCAAQLDLEDYEQIKRCSLLPQRGETVDLKNVVGKFHSWEINFRNALISLRLPKGADGSEYQLEESEFFSDIPSAVHEVAAENNPLAADMIINKLRWQKLSDLEFGHIFDLPALCIYKLKLLIVEQIKSRNEEQGKENLNIIVDNIRNMYYEKHSDSIETPIYSAE